MLETWAGCWKNSMFRYLFFPFVVVVPCDNYWHPKAPFGAFGVFKRKVEKFNLAFLAHIKAILKIFKINTFDRILILNLTWRKMAKRTDKMLAIMTN